jgi:cytochrome P450
MTQERSDTKSYLDVTDEDPYGFYEELRARSESGLTWDDGLGAWLVVRRTDCREVHKDEDTFAHRYLDFPGAAKVWGGERALLNLEGPVHTALHRFMLGFFSMRVAENYREIYVKPLVEGLLSKFADLGEGDLDTGLANRLPAYVIAALLGVSIDDEESLENFKDWTEATFEWVGSRGEDPDALNRALEAASHLDAFLTPIIRERRDGLGDDLISALWREGPKVLEDWGEQDMLAQARVILNAGSHSTSHLLRNCIFLLLTRPDLRDQLKRDPSLALNFVDETMRYLGVIHFHLRSVETDTQISGCPVAKGDRVYTMLSAANRDPEAFDDPLEFRLDRDNLHTHLGFGFGPRRCIGANLARLEAAEMVEQLLQRFPDMVLADDGPTPEMTGYMGRSYGPLLARWSLPSGR